MNDADAVKPDLISLDEQDEWIDATGQSASV